MGLSFLLTADNGAGAAYQSKIEALSPLAYFPLAETSGTAIVDVVNGWNGVYTGATVNNALGPDGVNNAPLFDGINDFGDLHTAALEAAFNTSTGGVFAWGKVIDADFWSDGQFRTIFWSQADSSNRIQVQSQNNGSGDMRYRYEGGGVDKLYSYGTGSPTDWQHYALTWNIPADELKVFYAGVRRTTITGLTVSSAHTVFNLGTKDQATKFWSGWLAHVVLFDSTPSEDDVLAAATV